MVSTKRLLLAFAVAALGCKRATAPVTTTRTINDAFNRPIALGSPIRRVISLAPSTTEIVFALGCGDRLVGVDRFSDYPEAAHAIPTVGSDTEPSTERIVGLQPQLILTATSANRQQTVDELGRLGLPVVVTKGDSVEQVLRDIAIVGAALEVEPAASALVAKLRAQFFALQQKSASLSSPPTRVAIIVWPDPLVVAGAGTHIDDLIKIAGGENIAADAKQPFPNFSVERLIQRAPAVLIIGSHKTESPPDLSALKRLTTVPAVRDGRIHFVDGDPLFRPGPRLGEAAATLFALLHP